MSAKLFAAGAALTVLALASEKHLPGADRREPVKAEATSVAVKVVSGIGTAFEAVTRSAVRQAIRTTDRSLDQLRPVVEAAPDLRGEHVRELFATATELSDQAKQELEAGRPFVALDLALSVNGRIGEIKQEFERE